MLSGYVPRDLGCLVTRVCHYRAHGHGQGIRAAMLLPAVGEQAEQDSAAARSSSVPYRRALDLSPRPCPGPGTRVNTAVQEDLQGSNEFALIVTCPLAICSQKRGENTNKGRNGHYPTHL